MQIKSNGSKTKIELSDLEVRQFLSTDTAVHEVRVAIRALLFPDTQQKAREIPTGISLHLAGDIFSYLERLPGRMREMFHADCPNLDFVIEAKKLQDRIWAAYGNKAPGALAPKSGSYKDSIPASVPKKWHEHYKAAELALRYFTDEAEREELEATAKIATDGNVTALEAILFPLQTNNRKD